MKMKTIILVAITIGGVACTHTGAGTEAAVDPSTLTGNPASMIEQGRYLVTISGCNDCHTVKVFTPQGMLLDSNRLLAGHVANPNMPPPAKAFFKPGNWVGMDPMATAFAGPWGVSYAANITPDVATGIGSWKEADFINTLRTGRHLGVENGRQLLPPMPWYNLAQAKDEDLQAIFAYLQSLPPVENRVPLPISP